MELVLVFLHLYSLASKSATSISPCYISPQRGWRHFTAWMGSVPATSANFRRILKRGSVAVIVGGIAEVGWAG